MIVSQLEQKCGDFQENVMQLRSELETTKYRLEQAERERQDLKRDQEIEIDDLERQNRMEIESVRQQARNDLEQARSDYREDQRELKKKLEHEVESERRQRIEALSQVSTQGALEQQRAHIEIEAKEHDIRIAKAEAERIQTDLDREKQLNDDLRQNLSTAASHATNMDISRQQLQAKIDYLESDSKSQSEAYATMERQMREAIDEAREATEKLRKEETLRRKLHNQVQELKGNIRVFCRVRPTLSLDAAQDSARLSFPQNDEEEVPTEIEIKGEEERNSLGRVSTKTHPFTFDRVFGPTSLNEEIFGEISQLIQSALDGYNVCIFCYGQTGSGKTFTMSAEDGMIPRALRQIYATSKSLEERGWKYAIEGSFVEVYNEDLNDLLARPGETDRKKHDIRHDTEKCETNITNITTVGLSTQEEVEGILTRAMANRSVAATHANARSSRSHSVFILKLVGENSTTGERSKGTLNLVDLAGSERLSQSKVEGARLKETQNINKSLSCLGDVIGALGSGKEGGHIPYRNSKLTYLLQYSLGGNSKTLMFVMVSPLQAHLGETLTSLKFATKVSLCPLGYGRYKRR